MPKRRPSADIDEEVIHLGVGSVIQLEQQKSRDVPDKPPIGFIWPKPKRKPRKRRT